MRLLAFLILLLAVLPVATASPEIQHWTTTNGARVYFVQAPEIPIIDVRFVFNAGSARDAGNPGIAHLTNKMLAEGAASIDTNAFNEAMADTGASFGTGALRDMAWVSLRTLSDSEYAEPALKLVGAALAAPRFDADIFQRLRDKTLIQIKQSEQSPGETARRAFYRAIYADHPYATPMLGLHDSVAALTLEQAQQFYQRYYVAENAVVAIVGALSRERAEQIVEQIAGTLPSGTPAAALTPVAALAEARTQEIEFPSIQSHVRIGQPGMKRGDADYFPLLVGNHVLGGSGLVSILFDEVRDKRGLSYSVNSYFRPMAQFGPFVASLQTDGSQTEEAVKVLRNELSKFVANGPTDEALADAKQNLIGGFPLRIDSNAKILEYLAMIGFYSLPLDYLDTFASKVAAVTVDDVKAAFARRVDPEKMVTVIVGQSAKAPAGS